MKTLRYASLVFAAIAALSIFRTPLAAAEPEPLAFVAAPKLVWNGETTSGEVTFALNRLGDVEVAIVDPQTSKVVRHLAAGQLGDNSPPPLVVGSASQKIAWDGKNDARQAVDDPARMAVRVRAGMRVALKQIVGGDSYGYFSAEMPHGDHSPWGINGVELKSDGKVYVFGHSSTLGPPALRQYDIHGNYLQTLFPPPAGKPIDAMRGWGIHVKPDGTYTPQFHRLTDPSLSTTILDGATGGMARLLPTPDAKHLSFWQAGFGAANLELQTINNDGTIPADRQAQLHGPLVLNPPMKLGPIKPDSHDVHAMIGPVFTCFAPDGKHFYLSGIFSAVTLYGSVKQIDAEGFWRDGQVWKVDVATRTAKPFFALEQDVVATAARDPKSPIGGSSSYAALHGVAVDAAGRVFIGDRLNQRIVVLDAQGKTLREIPLAHADALAVSHRSGALFVTTRTGSEYGGRGEVQLLKFNDWQKDDEPSASLVVSQTGYTNHHKHSYVVLCEDGDATNVWVAYTEMPVRIYRDDASGLTLRKDFANVAGAQRCMGFDRIDVDEATEEVYLLDDHAGVWKVSDWEKPAFVKTPLATASIAIDARRRHIYVRTLADGSSSNSVGKVARFKLDDESYSPANLGETGTNRLTPSFHHEWCFTGNGDKGIAIAPNGNVAVVGDPKDGLRLFYGDESKSPWNATVVAKLPDLAGGVRFDLAGNLYVGLVDKGPSVVPAGLEDDRFAEKFGRIYKFAPTGDLGSGNLFPSAPVEPAKVYDVAFGAFDADCVIRTPRFAIDGYGRIYCPTNIAQRVTVVDNAGNELLAFGTYGNRDSCGGLAGDAVPTRDIPLAFPNSVAVSDRCIYVGDMVNQRLLRIEKQFAVEARSK